MSRVGYKPIVVPKTVTISLSRNILSVKGPKGELMQSIPAPLTVRIENSKVSVSRNVENKQVKALHGTYRSLISNMIDGVFLGYTKELQVQGVGFKSAVQGKKAVFTLGFSSPVELAIPDGIEMKVTNNVNIVLSSINKQLVGDFAARIRLLYPAEPYKGKGIRFKGEHVRRKVGKKVA